MKSPVSIFIRQATVKDLSAAAVPAASWWREHKLPTDFIPAVWIANWTAFLNSGIGVMFLVERNGAIVGGVGGLLFPDPNDGKLVCSEAFWFMVKEFRGFGLALLKRLEAWAREMNCFRLSVCHFVGFNARLGKIYERLGFSPVECTYFKSLH